VDGVDERLGVDLGRLGERELGDEVGDGGADEVGADEGARLGVVDDLDEAVGVAGAEGLRERAERDWPTLMGMPAAAAFSSERPSEAISGAQ